MRTGAIFARRARGSCRALKWAALLGGFLVMGSVQAFAQAPTIDDAYYTAAQPNSVVVKMTLDVYGDGAVELLPGDFRLHDKASETADSKPFRIDGLAGSRLSADDSFTLVFDVAVKGHAIYYTAPTSPPAGQARSIVSERGVAFASVARASAFEVRAPTQTRELTLSIEAVRGDLEKARMRKSQYAPFQTFAATGVGSAIVLPAAQGPPGTPDIGTDAIKYELESSLLTIAEVTTTARKALTAIPTGLSFEQGIEDTTGDGNNDKTGHVRALFGTMPDVIGDYNVTYTAYTGDDADSPAAYDSVTFKLKIAAPPEAPTFATPATAVQTVSNSSIKVSWTAPKDNNDKILHYEISYKLKDHAAWETPVATTAVPAPTSHTLAGLDPGTYQVRVRAVNSLGVTDDKLKGPWSDAVEGSTGTGAQKPTTLAVDPTLPEGRDTIPVTVTATVEPSADPERTLSVQLKLAKGAKADTSAEISTKTMTESNPDVSWASPSATDPTMSKAVTFTFTSNLSSEQTIYLKTGSDDDAEDENFKISASSKAVANVFTAGASAAAAVMVDDDEVQVYELELPYQVTASMEIMEGYGGAELPVDLVVSPARTIATNYIVSLTSQEDSSDYSLLSPSSGSPSSVGTRVSLPEGSMGESLTLTPVQNDGDRVDDTVTLQLFMADASGTKGTQLGDDIVLTVLDRHKLPTVTLGAIKVDGAAVTSLAEGEKATVELLVDRGTTTDAIPDSESITIMLSRAATSTADADDYRIGSSTVSVGTKKSATFELEALVDEADVEDEMLVLQAEVTGAAANGPGTTVDLAAITITDGTTKLVWAKEQDEVESAISAAKSDGMGDDGKFTTGEMIEVMGSALFNAAEGVTLSYSAESSDSAVASAMSANGTVTVTGMGEGDAMITITAHASMPSSSAVMRNPQTDPRETSVTFPVEVGLEALSFTLEGPADMNIVEGGDGAMLTVTANRAVGMDTEVTIMRDRALSSAMDSDYTPVPTMITIKSGEMMGSVEIMATEDNMVEDGEELVLNAMVGDMMVDGQVKLYIWDAAVPALPIIAQLLLAAFLAIGGYRRYGRR